MKVVRIWDTLEKGEESGMEEGQEKEEEEKRI